MGEVCTTSFEAAEASHDEAFVGRGKLSKLFGEGVLCWTSQAACADGCSGGMKDAARCAFRGMEALGTIARASKQLTL